MGLKKDLGERIRVMRKSRDLTQEELAKLVGAKGASTIGMWETGKRTPEPESIEALADVFNVPISAFFDDQQPEAVPRTIEARILAAGIDKMPERDRERALSFVRKMFVQYADFFEGGTTQNDD